MNSAKLLRDKNSAFWLLQISGWIGYFLVRTLHGLTNDYSAEIVYIYAAMVGFVMTLAMRMLYRVVREYSLGIVLVCVITICSGFGLIFSSIELTIDSYVFNDPTIRLEGLARFSNAMFETTVLLAWSALYFGYYFYSAYNEQRQRALKATAMAHQAQLKMLRYQLNPHFLFNTLNAISTLVLEKSNKEANEMLTKLSSFLRYTLHNQPTQKISLDQEMHALGLYLEIEKVRFQDRLNIHYDIDASAHSALIPSLIFQPLVENAIKYAVAPAIEGGTLYITAYREEGRLKMSLVDTGPGLEDVNNLTSQTGSGVGLANTRERLAQLYGDTHTLSIENVPTKGLGIFIDLPFEEKSSRKLAS